jgi:hypothetical protein
LQAIKTDRIKENMYSYLLPLIAVVSMGFAGAVFAADAGAKSADNSVVYHVVSLKFKEGTTPEQIKAVETAFADLKGKIPEIRTLNWGTNVSPEKHDKGFTHCFVLTFKNAKDRDTYLTHDAHKAFGKVLGPVMADVMVLDFVSKAE